MLNIRNSNEGKNGNLLRLDLDVDGRSTSVMLSTSETQRQNGLLVPALDYSAISNIVHRFVASGQFRLSPIPETTGPVILDSQKRVVVTRKLILAAQEKYKASQAMGEHAQK